jgi:hypothetical protein
MLVTYSMNGIIKISTNCMTVHPFFNSEGSFTRCNVYETWTAM